MCETVIDRFYCDLFLCLNNFANDNQLPKIIDFKAIINRENGSKIKGDFSLNLVSPKYLLWHNLLTELSQYVVKQSAKWSSFSVINFKICDKIKLIQLFINRENGVKKLFKQFKQFSANQEVVEKEKNVLLISDSFNAKNEFTVERIKRVSQSLSKLLNTSCVTLKTEQICDELFEQLLELASVSTHCKTNDRNELIVKDVMKPILIDKTNRNILTNMWNLYQLIANNTKTDVNYTVIIVTLESHYYKHKNSFEIMLLLYNLCHSLKIIAVSNVISNYDFDDYVISLKDKLMEQNDDSVQQNPAENFDILVETSITLSLLTRHPSSVITKLESNLSEATFIQYNCARITAIINRYNSDLTTYKTEDEIDFSLLTHDLEWTLIFYHFPNYYSLISSLNNFIVNKSSFNLNQIVLFLKKFVTDISIFYKKVKVLTEPCLHLLPLINARIYLCQLILNILSNSLDLLGLKTVKYL